MVDRSNLRFIIAQVLAGITLALVLTNIIVGPEVMMATIAVTFHITAMTTGLIGTIGLLVLSAAAFVLSRKRQSLLVAGLLAASGIIFFLSPLTDMAHMTAMANSLHESYPHSAYFGLAILGLGVAKVIETRRKVAKIAVT